MASGARKALSWRSMNAHALAAWVRDLWRGENTRTAPYMFFVRASAGPSHTKYPCGEKHAAIVFVSTSNLEEAQRVAQSEMRKDGWDNVVLEKWSKVDPQALTHAEEQEREFVERAKKHGHMILI